MENGNEVQNRKILQQIADTAISKFHLEHPELDKRVAEIPPMLKWAGIIISSVMTVSISGMAIWLISSVSSMQVTLARVEERIGGQSIETRAKYDSLSERVSRIEAKVNKD